MNLHAAIMNLPLPETRGRLTADEMGIYREGMRDARHAAAELASAHEAAHQEALSLLAALAAMVRLQNGNLHDDVNKMLAHADRILAAAPARSA